MPANSHLEWVEVRDFSPGLWNSGHQTVGSILTPAQGSQVMDNCYPQPGGGLRAFHAVTNSTTSTGIANPTTEKPVGLLYIRIPSPAGSSQVTYLMTYNGTLRLYSGGVGSAWTLGKTFAAGAGDFAAFSATSWATQVLSTGVFKVYALVGGTGADPGVWGWNANGAPAYTKLTLPSPPSISGTGESILATHQSRLIVAEQYRLMWTDPGTETFSANNFLDIDPEEGSSIVALTPLSATDLLVVRQSGKAVVIQGDLSDPIIRTMPPVTHNDIVRQPNTYMLPDGRVPIIANPGGLFLGGPEFERVSAQIYDSWVPSSAGGLASLLSTAGLGNFLVSTIGGNTNGALVYDLATKSFFTISDIFGTFGEILAPDFAGSVKFLNAVGTSNVTNLHQAMYQITFLDNYRASSYTWVSAPMAGPDGRRLEIREIQLIVNPQNTAANRFDVTVGANVQGGGGTTQTTTLTAGDLSRQTLRFLFKEQAPVLDVKVLTSLISPSSPHEAPQIEAVRIGYRTRHLS